MAVYRDNNWGEQQLARLNEPGVAKVIERRAELDLQINLLDEYETTRILKLVIALAEKAGIECADPEIDELQEDVEPEQVLEKLETKSNLESS